MVQVKWLSIILSIFLPNPSESLQVQLTKAPKRNLTLLRLSALPEIQDTSSTAKESTSESEKDPVSDSDVSALTALAGNTAQCLILSDLKRKGGGDGSSTGWTSWVEEKSAFKLQCCVDLMSLSLPVSPISNKVLVWEKHPCFLRLFDLLFLLCILGTSNGHHRVK